jgi:site-specific DNA-methyltransferase (adenine-specific)
MSKFKIICSDITTLDVSKIGEFHQIVTSPPYWRQRQYGAKNEIGSEKHPEQYVDLLCDILCRLGNHMSDTGTMFVNLGDKHRGGELLGMPWRIALEMMDRNWVLKSEVIWHKRRIMPQPIKNRFICCHEHVFMFTKVASGHVFNYEEVMEDALWGPKGRNDRRSNLGPHRYRELRESKTGGHTAPVVIRDKRLCRSVWDISTSQGDKGHSATFPVGLPEKCILAGSNPGDTVLDPFCGVGTTGIAALRNGRNFVGVDVVQTYCEQAEQNLNSLPTA